MVIKILKVRSLNLDYSQEKVTVLCRTNAKIIENIIDKHNKAIFVVGGIQETLTLAKSGYALFRGKYQAVTHKKIKQFQDWAAMLRFNHQYQDAELTLLAGLIKRYGYRFDEVIKQVENANYTNTEVEADFVFSTIHKSKGREWQNVIVEDDFLIFANKMSIAQILSNELEEMNLIYVAITRAINNLHIRLGVSSFIRRLTNDTEEDFNSYNTIQDNDALVANNVIAVA